MILPVAHADQDVVAEVPNKPTSTCRYRNIKPRSEAQREASRLNGSRSRGPTSIAGKRRSRRNALKHGLRAKKLGPPADARGLDRDYERIHEELVNEFGPVTYSELRAVAALARDYQQLDLIDQMINTLVTPSDFLNESVKQRYRTIRLAKREARLTKRLIATLKSEEAADLKPNVADRLAEQVVAFVTSLEEDLAEASDDLSELLELERRGELCDADRDNLIELKELQRQQRQINRCRRVLHNKDRLSEAFRGERKPGKVERRILIGILSEIRQHAATRSHDDQNVLGRLNRAAENQIRQLASDPEKLIALEGYREQLVRSIRRHAADLRTLCG